MSGIMEIKNGFFIKFLMKYNLPRKYFSYSQYSCFKRSREEYYKQYILNEKRFETREILFGRKIASLLESSLFTEKYPTFPDIPHGEKPEFRVETKIRGVPVLSIMDSYSPSTASIFEYKTGREEWNQERVNKHAQLTFYSMAVKHHFGNYDPNVILCWLETKLIPRKEVIDGIEYINENPKDMDIDLTGNIKIFTRTIKEKEIVELEEDILKVVGEISKMVL